MVKLKLNLKLKRPKTVYASNGKAYRLQPGANTLELEYEDYLALVKTLKLKPLEDKEAVKESKKEHVKEVKSSECISDPACNKEAATEACVSNEEINLEESLNTESDTEDKELVSDEQTSDNESLDYSTMSYNKLKAAYKAITGKYCKLKKEEVIAFLQEHS